MSDSGEQTAPSSDEQTPPSSAQLPDSRGKMSDSGEQSDSDEQTAPSSDEQTPPSSAQLPDSSGKMSDSGEQSDSDEQTAPSSDEQTAPSSAQLPDSSGQEAQDSGEAAPNSGEAAPNSGEAAPNSEDADPNSEENPDSGEASIPEENPDSGEAAPNSEENPDPSEAAEDSEENTESSEPAPPAPENTPASSVGETAGKKNFDFEGVRAALAETIPGFVGQQAQVNPLRLNFNASSSGEASVAEAPKLMPNPPSWIEDSDEEGFQGQQEAANPNEQETDSGEPEVQSAPPPEVIIMTPADWKKALSDQAKAEEEEEKENPKEVVPKLIHNTNLQQAELKERAVAHPSLIGGSSMNPDPAAAVQKPDSHPSESAAENVELGKRKIDEKGKGKLEENQEDGGEEVSEEEEAASPRSKIPKKSQDERLAIGDPSSQARSNMNPALPPATPVTKPDLKPSESAAEGKRKIGEKGKGSKGQEESDEDEAASPNSKKLKGPQE